MNTLLTNKVTAANTTVTFCLSKPAHKATANITAFPDAIKTVQNKHSQKSPVQILNGTFLLNKLINQ